MCVEVWLWIVRMDYHALWNNAYLLNLHSLTAAGRRFTFSILRNKRVYSGTTLHNNVHHDQFSPEGWENKEKKENSGEPINEPIFWNVSLPQKKKKWCSSKSFYFFAQNFHCIIFHCIILCLVRAGILSTVVVVDYHFLLIIWGSKRWQSKKISTINNALVVDLQEFYQQVQQQVGKLLMYLPTTTTTICF